MWNLFNLRFHFINPLEVDAHYNYFQWVDEVEPQIEPIPHTKESIPILFILQVLG